MNSVSTNMRAALNFCTQAAVASHDSICEKAKKFPLPSALAVGFSTYKATRLLFHKLIPLNTNMPLSKDQVGVMRNVVNVSCMLSEMSQKEIALEKRKSLQKSVQKDWEKAKANGASQDVTRIFEQFASRLSSNEKSIKGLKKEELLTLTKFYDEVTKEDRKRFLGEKAADVFSSLKKILERNNGPLLNEYFLKPVKELEGKFRPQLEKMMVLDFANKMMLYAGRVLSVGASAAAAYYTYLQITASNENL